MPDEELKIAIALRHSGWGGPRPRSLAFSLLLHSAVVFALFWFSSYSKTIVDSAPYEQAINPQDKRIVWYHLKELPKISPEKPGEAAKIRAERLNPAVIIQEAPDAAHDDRLVFRAPDRKAPDHKTPAADLIAVERGANATTPAERPVEAPAAATPVKPVPKAFVAPAAPPPTATAQIKLQEPPPSAVPPKLEIPDAALTALTAGGKVRFSRQFVPPTPEKRAAPGETAGAALVPDAPSLPGAGGASDISALIINTVNSGVIGAAPPRQSAISAGPVTGTPSDNGGRSGIQIGGVTVIPGAGKTSTAEASLKSPKDPFKRPVESTTGAQPYITTRVAPLEHTLSAPLPPSSRNIPKLIEARFRGRTVYTMLLPMKGLPGYAGDWTIWFAERQPNDGAGSTAPMRAPLPIRKPVRTDAVLVPSPGEFRLSATLNKTGRMDSIAVIDGSGPAAAAAIKDLEGWEFLPALRNREPVEIDIIVDISFGISPKTASPARVPVLPGVDRTPPDPHN